MQMAGVAGVEPTSAVLETVILPLNYTPKTNKLYHIFLTYSTIYYEYLWKKVDFSTYYSYGA